jgi:hypothetical protein
MKRFLLAFLAAIFSNLLACTSYTSPKASQTVDVSAFHSGARDALAHGTNPLSHAKYPQGTYSLDGLHVLLLEDGSARAQFADGFDLEVYPPQDFSRVLALPGENGLIAAWNLDMLRLNEVRKRVIPEVTAVGTERVKQLRPTVMRWIANGKIHATSASENSAVKGVEYTLSSAEIEQLRRFLQKG